MGLFNLIEHLPFGAVFEAAGKAMDGELGEAATILAKGVALKETKNYIGDKLSGSSDGGDNSTYDD